MSSNRFCGLDNLGAPTLCAVSISTSESRLFDMDSAVFMFAFDSESWVVRVLTFAENKCAHYVRCR